MLSSEFTQEMGALIRRLEARVRHDPTLINADGEDLLFELEDAIVTLCALHVKLERLGVRDIQ
jgi:hypothetical protein